MKASVGTAILKALEEELRDRRCELPCDRVLECMGKNWRVACARVRLQRTPLRGPVHQP